MLSVIMEAIAQSDELYLKREANGATPSYF
jgi:hypothetical protein